MYTRPAIQSAEWVVYESVNNFRENGVSPHVINKAACVTQYFRFSPLNSTINKELVEINKVNVPGCAYFIFLFNIIQHHSKNIFYQFESYTLWTQTQHLICHFLCWKFANSHNVKLAKAWMLLLGKSMPTINRPAVLGAKILNSKGLFVFFKYIVLHIVTVKTRV